MSHEDPVDQSDDDEDVVSIHHRMPNHLKKKLQHKAVEEERSMTSMINDAIVLYMN